MKAPHELYAIVAELERPGQWNIVGLWSRETGHFPCVNSKLEVIERYWEYVDPDIKKFKNARIARYVETGGIDEQEISYS